MTGARICASSRAALHLQRLLIGVALKLHLAVTASAEGIETMRTTNLDRNTSALRMNDALGFRRVPGSIELRKSLSGAAVRFQG
jgi:hypothetical protein